jgi:hypothetical protein
LQRIWAGNLTWAWWVSCSSSSEYKSSNEKKEHLCTKLSTPRTLWGSSRWRTPRPWRCLWVQLQLLMRMRKVNTWTKRSTRAWSGHSSTWRRRGQTSNSQYVCALVFKRLQGHHISRRSSAFSSACVTLPTSAFGTLCPLLWLFMVFQTRILTGVGWMGSPLLGLISSWNLLWCLGLPTNSWVLLNPLPRQSMLPQLVVALISFESHSPWVTLMRSIAMFHFNVTTQVS